MRGTRMSMVRIAVIVPVYNGEKYLPEFLSCLVQQTMQDFEAYFVDDCSTDQTGVLLQEAAEQHAGFHYLSNGIHCGAAQSRNRGIESSCSEYVLCLDADDCIADDLLEQLVRAGDLAQADMVMLERLNFVRPETIRRNHDFLKDDVGLYQKGQDDSGQRVFRAVEQPEDFLIRCQNATYDRMVRRALLDKYRIRFQDLPSSNDVFYSLFSIFAAESIVHTETSDFLYYRRIHSEPGRISNDRDPMCAFEALCAVKEALVQYHLWEECCVHFWIFALDSLEKQLFVCRREDRQREVYLYLQEEGLRALGVPDDALFDRLPASYRKQFALFLTRPYEEKCFKDSMTFHALCESSREKIVVLFDYVERNCLRLGYWGVGRMTEGFVSAAVSLGKKIDYFVDNNKEKLGKRVFNIEVVSYDSIKEQTGLLVISNKQYYHEIFEQIKAGNEDMKVLSIQEYLYGNGSLEEFIR